MPRARFRLRDLTSIRVTFVVRARARFRARTTSRAMLKTTKISAPSGAGDAYKPWAYI